VTLDRDLAVLYGVEPKVLIQAVKRNLQRLPRAFMFQLNREDVIILKSQIVTSSSWGAFAARPMPSPSRESRCSPACFAAPALDALEEKYDAQFRVVFGAGLTPLLASDYMSRHISTRAEGLRCPAHAATWRGVSLPERATSHPMRRDWDNHEMVEVVAREDRQ
jgi:hypothetical protein